MAHEFLVSLVLFTGFFLVITAFMLDVAKRYTFLPYTVGILGVGIICQFIVHLFNIPIEIHLPAETIYYILLPLLLFESAIQINIHQFQLQFKTISFFATFGLLVSILFIACALFLTIGYPFEIALLFGAIISATDPIAVISLFKTLGAPKRLALVADGESMFNDATGVIAFKLVSGLVLSTQAFTLDYIGSATLNFLYLFIGSMLFGAFSGYIFSKIVEKIHNDRLIETTLTIALALGSFVIAETMFHLSGVISTVMAAIVFGHLARTRVSYGVTHFMHEMWEYVAFLCVSLVFFFTTFNLDFDIFSGNLWPVAVAVIATILARAVSVYLSSYLVNVLPFFKNEPNIPLDWQHILNWGGLRGVIPLVLVYSLPESFAYRNDMLAFTFGALLTTLFINGLTIRFLLLKLGLHLPKKEEQIIQTEKNLIGLNEVREFLTQTTQDIDPQMIHSFCDRITKEEFVYRKQLLEMVTPEELEKSLQLEALNIEREKLQDLFVHGYISENVYYDFDTELDIQQDVLEYPELQHNRGYDEDGMLKRRSVFRDRLHKLHLFISRFPFLKSFFTKSEERIVQERIGLLKARVITSQEVNHHFERLKKLFVGCPEILYSIEKLSAQHKHFIDKNQREYDQISRDYSAILEEYQTKLLYNLVSERGVSSLH